MSNPLLTQLKDIHTPEAITWYPLAMGYYLLALLLLLSVLTGIFFWYRRQQQRLALVQLEQEIRQLPMDGTQYLTALNILIKRGFLSYYPREKVANLDHQTWIELQSLALSTEEASLFQQLHQQRFSPHALSDVQMQQLQRIGLKVVRYALPFQQQIATRLWQEAIC